MDCFCLFDGDSFSAGLLYLFPQQIGIGQLQPYVRHSEVYPDGSSDRDEFETGVNYVIDGHNARVSLISVRRSLQQGDLRLRSRCQGRLRERRQIGDPASTLGPGCIVDG